MSVRAKALAYLMLFFGVFGILEVICGIGIKLFDRRVGLQPVTFPANDPSYYERAMRMFHFDPDIAWDMPTPVRSPQEVVPGRRYAASAYGDSVTYCREVKDDETWEHYFERNTGHKIVNLGVAGGAPDMAYLKIRKYYDLYPSDVVLMCVLPENVNRLGSTLRKFLNRADNFPLVKPRYEIHDSQFELYWPPIYEPDDVMRVGDRRFLSGIAQHDYFYQWFKRRYGFDLVWGRSFPYTFEFLQLLKGEVLLRNTDPGYIPRFAQPDDELYRILLFVMDQFLALSRKKGFKPAVVLHTTRQDVPDDSFVAPFIAHLTTLGVRTFEVSAAFRSEVQANRVTVPELFAPNGHYSPRGNEIVAEALANFMRREALTP